MAYFNDDQAREIIRETYGQVSSHGPVVAEGFYSPEELAGEASFFPESGKKE